MQHAIITDAHVRLCILRGTKIDTEYHSIRYYYKGLCVVARKIADNAGQDTVSSFWILPDAKTQRTFTRALQALRRREGKNTVYKKATSRLLMLKQA
jgi:hypothetical protein